MSRGSRRLQLLYVASECPVPPHNGVRRKAFELLKEVSAYRSTDLVYFDKDSSESREIQRLLPNVRSIYRVDCSELAPGYVRARRLAGIANPDYYFRRRYGSLPPDLVEHIDLYDYVHVDTVSLGHLIPPLVAGGHKRRIVWSLNDSYSRALLWRARTSKSCALLAAGLRFCAYEAMRGRDCFAVDVVSPLEARHLARLGLINAEVHTLGRPSTWESEDSTNRTKAHLGNSRTVRLGIMSSLDGIHGEAVVTFLRQVWPYIRASTDSELTVVGRLGSNGMDRILKASEGVRHVSRVDRPEEFLRQIDISVAPLDMPLGIPNKAIEALAAGIPVFGMRCLEALKQKQDGRGFVIAKSWDELAQLLRNAIEDKRDLWAMGQAARDYMAEWPTWEEIGRRYVSRMIA